jgi:hypothetical protein
LAPVAGISALTSTSIGAVGIGTIAVLVVIGIVLAVVISALIARVLILVIVVALAVVVWQQRSSVENAVKHCKTNVSFLGVHVDAPASVRQACRNLSR